MKESSKKSPKKSRNWRKAYEHQLLRTREAESNRSVNLEEAFNRGVKFGLEEHKLRLKDEYSKGFLAGILDERARLKLLRTAEEMKPRLDKIIEGRIDRYTKEFLRA